MAGIRSSIGSTTTRGGTPLRNFTVGDESQQSIDNEIRSPLPQKAPQTYEELENLRKQHTHTDAEVAPEARKRIELLLGIGKLTKNVEVKMGKEVITYTLRTLKNKENASLISIATRVQDGDATAFLALKVSTLAYAIESIEGVPMDAFLGLAGLGEEDKFEQKKAFLEEMESSLVTFLYDEFSGLAEKGSNQYGISSVEKAEEVRGDLKK